MQRVGRLVTSSGPLVLALAVIACGGHGAPGPGDTTVGNRGGRPTADAATPQATLADDLDELQRAAREGDQQSSWPERSTLLGWTADHRAVYRTLVCNPDELGGRGPYCELRVCAASARDGADGPACEDAAQFELYGEIDFDRAAVAAAVDAAVRAVGPLDIGTARAPEDVRVDTAGKGLAVELGGARVVVMAPSDDDAVGIARAHVTYAADSPDGACQLALGDAQLRSEYEGVYGNVPYLFAAVACTGAR